MIPESHVDIFEAESYAHFATVMPDGTPHVTPVGGPTRIASTSSLTRLVAARKSGTSAGIRRWA